MKITRTRLLASSIICGMTLAASGQSLAQEAGSSELIVTGSRIPVTNVTSASPISVATAAQIQMTNAVSVADVLSRLPGPDSTAGLTSNSNNGGVGFSEVGLRNLGPSRTVILIDGQRLVPIFAGASSVPDLNSVPVSMIDRVEVLRDGASSVYGADAIGGVINIITKKDFDGARIDAHGGLSQHGGGKVYGIGGTIGLNAEKGNVTVSVLYDKQDPLNQTARQWAQDAHIGDPNYEGGSIYRSQLNILQDVNSHTVWNNGIETTYNDPTLASVPCLTFLPSLGRVKLNAGCPAVVPPQTLTSGLQRTQISFSAHYDVAPNLKLIADGFYTDRHSEQRLRPEPLLGTQIASTNPLTGAAVYGGFMVPVSWPGYTDPNLTASPQPCADPAGCIVANLTPNEWGPRDYRQVSQTYRIRAGLEGRFFDKFNWEAGYVHQRNDNVQRTLNSGNWLHLAEATGQMPCIDVPGGCTFNPAFGYSTPTTPFNFFNGVGTMTPAQVKYLTFTITDNNWSYENYAYADINGALFDLPAGPLQASIGFERRYEHLADNPDSLSQLALDATSAAPTDGGYDVTSFYGELRIPLLKGVPLVDSLVVTPSVRHDNYSTFGSATTWKVGVDWAVTKDLRLRGTYATGYRAPSTAELFGGNTISYIPVGGDPCDSRAAGLNGNTNAGTGSLAAGSACYTALAALGLNAAAIAAYNSPENDLVNDQRALIIGGNPNLQPETSRSWNIGAVLTPRFLPGLSFDADYYQVKISNSIITGGIGNTFGPDLIVTACYVQQNPYYCGLISRTASGIFQISSLNTNFGVTEVHGLDLEATFSTAAAGMTLPVPGSFTLNLQAERQFKNKAQQPDPATGAPTDISFLGFFVYANESSQPKWKGRLNLDYKLDKVQFHWSTQWIGNVDDYDDPTNHVYGNYVPNYFYHDVSVSFDLPTVGPASTTLIFGINNLLDKDPPFIGQDAICKCNSLAGPYDFIGRQFFARASARF